MSWVWLYLWVSLVFCAGWLLGAWWASGRERRFCATCDEARKPRQREIPSWVEVFTHDEHGNRVILKEAQLYEEDK